ncbi:MAG: PVC-type heme-binding CxxCH protein, partial [Verrucomicrobiota bacterium]
KLRKLDGSFTAPAVAKAKSEAKPFPETKLETMKFDVADGFEVNLYAENPLLAKPIQMNFDPQGRLWIASSEVYPQIAPGQEAKDKVLILEDTDGDGVAEKSTVFADGLLIPTGVAPGDGGVYVGQSTELLHFKDTNGDGKADQKRIVLSGFGTEDTHHIVHTLRWAHDGQLYFNQSIYIRTYTETPHGVVRLESGGIFNYRPPTMELDVLFRGWVNSWGHHFDKYGQSFVTDGAGFQGVHWGLPGAMYFTYAGARRIMDSISPGNYPKFCGLEMIYSEQFPSDFQGDVVTCDFRAHRVVRFKISEQGAGYVTKEMPDLLRTADVSFRPIDVKFGPDGALYVADWSNPIIQHGEVDFRDPRRDHEHGRIWRITAKGRPPVARQNVVKANNRELLNNLLSPTGFVREQSSRVLTERGSKAVQGDLKRWMAAQKTEEARLEGLWMYQAIDVVEPALLKELLVAKDGHIRAAATRVLSYWMNRIPEAETLLTQRIADDHPRVRVEAMRALSKIPTARSAELVLATLDMPMDPFLDYAVWLSINDLAQPWIEAVRSGAWKIEGREKQVEFALKAIEPQLASTVLAQLLKAKPLARNGAGPWIELIGQAGTAAELRLLLDTAVNGGLDDAATVRALNALGEALRLRKLKPTGDPSALGKLIGAGPDGVRAAAVRLAGSWRLTVFAQPILQIAGDGKASAVRDAAFDSLREMGGKPVVEGLRKLTTPNVPPAVRRQAAAALGALDRGQSMPQIIDVLRSTTNEAEALELWRALLNLKGMAGAIAGALPSSGFPEPAAQAGLRAAREGGRTETELVLALSKAAGLTLSDKELSPEELQAMAAKALKQGDPARGERVYRRADLGCTLCHAIGGAGGKVGPDMTSIGASAPADYLVESLLFPNSKIKEGYHSTIIETKDEQEFSGVLVRETSQELILRNAANEEVSVAKNNIRARKNGLSLMPSGLVDVLSEQERLDLFRFLSELGKPGQFDAAKGNVARSWRLLAGTHRIEQFGVDKIVNLQVTEASWKPFLAFVSGGLPEEEILTAMAVTRNIGLVSIYAATDFQVAKAGDVKFKVPDGANVMAWVDGKQVKGGNLLTANLPAGRHTIIVRLDAKNVPPVLRLESGDVSFLAN